MQISTQNRPATLPGNRQLTSPEAGGQTPACKDGFQPGESVPPTPAKPTWTPPKPAEPSALKKILGGKAAAVAGGLAVGAGAGAVGMMGGTAGAIAGGIGGAALGTAAVVGLAGYAFVGLAKESPIAAVALLFAAGAVAAVLSPVIIGGAVAGAVAIGGICTAGGPIAGALAGLGGGLIGAVAVDSIQKSFR